MQIVEKEFSYFKRSAAPASVVVVDLNNLKQINDIYGHFSGDQAIIKMVQQIKRAIRLSDSIGRIGGDEFLILFRNTAMGDAIEIMLRIQDGFNDVTVQTQNGLIPISISFGLDMFQSEDNAYTDAIQRADRAYYHFKQQAGAGK